MNRNPLIMVQFYVSGVPKSFISANAGAESACHIVDMEV